MTILFANNANSSLASPITTSATSLTLATGQGALFPSPSGGDYFVLSLTDAATGDVNEITHCTARSGDVCTVVRAQEGTTALNWTTGDFANNRFTAGQASQFSQGASFANPMTTLGDIITGGASGAAQRLGIGTGGFVLTVVSGAPAWAASFVSPMTTKGDLIVGGTSGAPARLGVGTDTYVLTADSTQTDGVKWAAPAAASGNPPAYNPQTGTAYTLALTDAPAASSSQGIVSMNNASANAVTVPPHSSVAWVGQTMIQVIQLGAGQTTITPGAGVTVLNASSLTARAQNSTLLLTYLGSDVWVLSGDNT